MQSTQNSVLVDIIRHGESWSNAGLPTDAPHSIPLTDKGRAQAHAVAESFNGMAPPGLIVISPYTRTGDTAAPTIARFPQVPVEMWPIHEFTHLDLERYRGTTREDRHSGARAYWTRNDPDYVDGVGAESFNQMIGRVDGMFNRLQALRTPHATVFCHGLFMQAALMRLERPDLQGADLMRHFDAWRPDNHVPNTGRLRLAVQPSHVRVVSRW